MKHRSMLVAVTLMTVLGLLLAACAPAATEAPAGNEAPAGTEAPATGDLKLGIAFDTGGRYDPATDAWTATTTVSAPWARVDHTAVWTGTEMIVWGGCYGGECDIESAGGGRYDPATDSWVPTSGCLPTGPCTAPRDTSSPPQ